MSVGDHTEIKTRSSPNVPVRIGVAADKTTVAKVFTSGELLISCSSNRAKTASSEQTNFDVNRGKFIKITAVSVNLQNMSQKLSTDWEVISYICTILIAEEKVYKTCTLITNPSFKFIIVDLH